MATGELHLQWTILMWHNTAIVAPILPRLPANSIGYVAVEKGGDWSIPGSQQSPDAGMASWSRGHTRVQVARLSGIEKWPKSTFTHHPSQLHSRSGP